MRNDDWFLNDLLNLDRDLNSQNNWLLDFDEDLSLDNKWDNLLNNNFLGNLSPDWDNLLNNVLDNFDFPDNFFDRDDLLDNSFDRLLDFNVDILDDFYFNWLLVFNWN